MRIIRSAFLATLSFWALACVGLKQDGNTKLVFEFEKTPCFGECPTYSMKFYENGRVLLTGKQFIDKIGAYELKAKPAQVSDLSQELDEMGFCDMKKMYGSDAMDFPSNIIKYQCGGEEKTVKAISNIPPPLVDFIEKVDGLRELDEWIKLDTVAE